MSPDLDIMHPVMPPPSFDLRGQVALVTGGSQGIGWGISSALAAAGADVVIANRNIETGNAAAAKLRDEGHRAEFVGTDLSDDTAINSLFAEVARRHGHLDVLVNNAGIVVRGQADALPTSDWDRQLAVNLRAPWLCARAAAELMTHPDGGRIINIASLNAVRPGQNKFAYGVSKAGLVQLTRALATEWAPRQITVNAIAPGMIAAPRLDRTLDDAARNSAISRIPLGRAGTIDEVGALALFLASGASGYITGQVIIVDGGSCLT
jgi:NAD(P)-dependent dehydrogenase (short-subunit alcohol dehydrogenase family)